MLLYVDFDDHDVSFYPDSELQNQLAELQKDGREGSRVLYSVDAKFQTKQLAYNVDGEFKETP